MPNRILKDSICMSESIDNLSPEAEVLFYRIIVQCDDFGRMDARLSVIRAKCYPLKIDELTDEYISNLIHELLENEMLLIYKSQDKYFIQIPSWDKHQQIRAKKSKYPEPDYNLSNEQSIELYPYQEITTDINGNHNISSDSNSNPLQVKSNDITCTRNPIQSNPINTRNRNTIIATSEKVFSDEVLKITKTLIDLMLKNNPNVKLPDNYNHWYLEVDRMIRIDKRDIDDIYKVIKFSQHDNFWMTNILSTSSLRKGFDKLYLRVKNSSNNGQKFGGHKQDGENPIPE
jgi:hypothetical protein